MTETKTLHIEQAVVAAGVSRHSLYNWMAEGRLPFVKVRCHRRVLLADVLEAKRYMRGFNEQPVQTTGVPA